jgi:hypothetical protein
MPFVSYETSKKKVKSQTTFAPGVSLSFQSTTEVFRPHFGAISEIISDQNPNFEANSRGRSREHKEELWDDQITVFWSVGDQTNQA